MLITLACAAMTVIFFIVSQVSVPGEVPVRCTEDSIEPLRKEQGAVILDSWLSHILLNCCNLGFVVIWLGVD